MGSVGVGAGNSVEGFGLARLAQQDFHLLLGLPERDLALASEGHSALESLQGFFERQVALLELLDDGFKIAQGFLEIGRSCAAGVDAGLLGLLWFTGFPGSHGCGRSGFH